MTEKKSNIGQAKDGRARNWCAVVYPESAPENWRDVLDAEHFEWVESPLHDRDVDANGELKKPHWHILLAFENKKSFTQIKVLTDAINAPIPQQCASMRGTVRYMAHLDNPDKVQYSQADIIAHGGFNLQEMLKPTAGARHALLREIVTYIRDEKITEFADLMSYALEERTDDWFPLLCDSSTIMLTELIKSQWRKRKAESEKLGYHDRLVADQESAAARDELYGKRDE